VTRVNSLVQLPRFSEEKAIGWGAVSTILVLSPLLFSLLVWV
jgi:hypothetical protein